MEKFKNLGLSAVVVLTMVSVTSPAFADAPGNYPGVTCYTEWQMKKIGPIKTRIPVLICVGSSG